MNDVVSPPRFRCPEFLSMFNRSVAAPNQQIREPLRFVRIEQSQSQEAQPETLRAERGDTTPCHTALTYCASDCATAADAGAPDGDRRKEDDRTGMDAAGDRAATTDLRGGDRR